MVLAIPAQIQSAGSSNWIQLWTQRLSHALNKAIVSQRFRKRKFKETPQSWFQMRTLAQPWVPGKNEVEASRSWTTPSPAPKRLNLWNYHAQGHLRVFKESKSRLQPRWILNPIPRPPTDPPLMRSCAVPIISSGWNPTKSGFWNLPSIKWRQDRRYIQLSQNWLVNIRLRRQPRQRSQTLWKTFFPAKPWCSKLLRSKDH